MKVQMILVALEDFGIKCAIYHISFSDGSLQHAFRYNTDLY